MKLLLLWLSTFAVASGQEILLDGEESDEDINMDALLSIPADKIPLVCGLPTDVKYEQFTTMNPPMCIVVSDTNYTAFYPLVDDFTLVEIQNSFNAAWLDQTAKPTHVRVEVGGKSSVWRRRFEGFDESTKKVVPFWTVIFELSGGSVDRITWDPDCPCCGCESSHCLDGQTCSVPYTDCLKEPEAEGAVDCDLKMYVGWFGTDKNNNYLVSAGKRLSRFRKYSLKGAFDSALKQAIDVKNVVQSGLTGR